MNAKHVPSKHREPKEIKRGTGSEIEAKSRGKEGRREERVTKKWQARKKGNWKNTQGEERG